MGCCSNKDSAPIVNNTQSKTTPKRRQKKSNNKCLVYGCQQNHNNHYCKICPSENSDHFARKCPNSMLAYHGTTKDASEKILNTGFISSTGGGRGAGVYFTDRRDIAAQIATWRAKNRNLEPIVFQCRIPLDLIDGTDKGYHGIWTGATTQGFTQYVVRDPKRIKILNAKDP